MAIFQFAFCRFSRPGSFRGLTHHLLAFLSRREMSHVYPVPVSFNMAKNKSPVGVFLMQMSSIKHGQSLIHRKICCWLWLLYVIVQSIGDEQRGFPSSKTFQQRSWQHILFLHCLLVILSTIFPINSKPKSHSISNLEVSN